MPDANALDPGSLMAGPVAQWLALQRAKNTAEGVGDDNLLNRVFSRGDPYYAPPPAPAAARPIWSSDNPVGTSVLHDTYAGRPSPDVSPVIGVYGAHPVTAAMRANALNIASMAAQFGPADVGAIKAFHGSPADFNAFSDKYIGTGEGAQAFGYGHYGAGAEGTGQTYKRPSKTLEWNGQPVEPGQPAYDLVDDLSNQDWRLGKIVEQATKYGPANAVETFEPHTRNASDGAAWRAAMDKFKTGAGKSVTGYMYELAIHADPEHMLDWDRPLSEQSQHVQDALTPHVDAIKQQMVKAASGWGTPSAQEAAAYQKQADDLVSRMRGETFVQHITSPPYGSPGHGMNDPAAAAQKLRDAGIPGIRYLDQGSRGAGEGTSNFVIFDPATIEILRKYGIAGLIAGGGVAATGTSSQNQQ